MRVLISFVVVSLLVALISADNCPPSSQMVSCSPKCTGDSECSVGTKCCPNICNQKSCTQSNKSGSGSAYKAGISTATGTYCGNSKCSVNEKCVQNKKDNKAKCVRN